MTNPIASDLISMIRMARRQHRPGTGTVYDKLLRRAGTKSEWLARELRSSCGVETVNGDEMEPDFSMLNAAMASTWRCVVLRSKFDSVLRLGTEDPWDEALLHKASMLVGESLTPAAVTFADLCRWLGRDGGMSMCSRALEVPSQVPVPAVADMSESERDGAAQEPVIKFADDAITAALTSGSTDIHFECNHEGVTVKHRRDGVLTPFSHLEGMQQAEEVISRIKVLAQLDVSERRLPQDGRFLYRQGHSNSASVDLRVSIVPSVFGEDAVLRLHDKSQGACSSSGISLDALGIETEHALLIRELATQPSGMLLVTGPSGSGKTTTVYAALSEINTGREKIITIEDPVEYVLPGVLQIPVNERRGLTFAQGLKSVLRHDPDRILIGEMRDAETAGIAVQSALTGHLVFTTVHANSVNDVIARMRHFGLDMFSLMSSLNGIVAQRLVRRICSECRSTRETTASERAWLSRFGQHKPMRVPYAVGCPVCHGSGYCGRLVLTEVHLIDDTCRDLVTEGVTVSALKQHVYREGVEPLSAQAARRVRAGDTTLEEIRRVLGSYSV